MSQFRSSGQLDDPIGEDGDRGFTGINQRLQLNQLRPSEVRASVNGRMEGYWKPRKNVQVKSSGLSTGATPLRLPFYLIDTAKSITAASQSSGVVTITVTSHGMAESTTGWATVSGITGYTGPNPNGVFLLTRTGVNTFTYVLPSSAGTYGVSSALLSATNINDLAVSTIYGSCLFSDPASNNDESILVATNSVVKRISLSTFTTTDIALPSGETIDAEVGMLQCFDKVIIMRNGDQPLEWNGVTGSSFVKGAAGVQVQPEVFSTVPLTAVNGVITVTAGTTQLNGSGLYTDGGANDTIVFPEYDNNGIKISTVNGFYVGCAIKIAGHVGFHNISAYDGASRTATFPTQNQTSGVSQTFLIDNTLGIHNLSVGDQVKIMDANALQGLSDGDIYTVATVPTARTFTFYADIQDHASHNITLGKTQSLGAGFIANPGAPWGTYFQRRLWVPYWYDQTGNYLSPAYVDRKVRDELAASDILDNNTFDAIYSQFKISGGTADYTVGLHGFYDDGLIVLNRNSLHKISNTQGSLLDTTVKELTNEVGCLARKSVVMQGNTLLFLSDNGVYGLEFIDLYNLRGTDQPISMMIQPYIDRINKDLADKAVATYYDNRYWIAVPLDTVAGSNDAVGNNTILIFNFLNKGWESIDTYENPNFTIMDFHVASAGVRNDLYAVTANGGLHKIDANEGLQDLVSIDVTSEAPLGMNIAASLTTRGYDMGDLGRKRFTDVQLQMQALPEDSSAAYDISFSAEDPDNSSGIGNTKDMVGETLQFGDTANVRARVGGVRGYTGTIIFNRTKGSPKIHSVKLAASITNRSIITQN
jgi:hypothetical protein